MSLSGSIDKVAEKNIDSEGKWRLVLKQAWRKPAELLEYLQLDSELLNKISNRHQQFPLLAPPAFVEQIEKGNPQDPLFLQIFPFTQKNINSSGLLYDPVGDLKSHASPGLLHKYSSRALIITTGACAIHCRYCFRQHFPYSSATGARKDWQQSLKYLEANPQINEVILSGGDPLMLDTKKLNQITAKLSELPQIKTLRIHTRMASCLPERINSALIKWLSELPFAVVVVHHINHPQEIGTLARHAFKRLQSCTQIQLNQSVLLKGINDKVVTLSSLSEILFANNIIPYYLHQMDPVEAAGDFICSDKEALKLFNNLRRKLPGYLLPRMVREVQGEAAKTPI